MTITGIVTTREGSPIPGAVVMIVAGTASYPEIAAVADGDGRFRLPCDGPGSFTLLVRTPGGAVWTGKIEARAGSPEPVHLTPRETKENG